MSLERLWTSFLWLNIPIACAPIASIRNSIHKRIADIAALHTAPTPRFQISPSTRAFTNVTMRRSMSSSSSDSKKTPPEPRPSASILLFSPKNEILLLHRVQTSTSFPSAHVFPGGNLSSSQDGDIPDPNDPQRHEDGPAYRIGAIRECFEESGILLARRDDGSGDLLEVPEAERERARKDIHAGKLKFVDWVHSQGGIVDTESLIPFTRWITPTNLPKRFTTQMYCYFLPLPQDSSISVSVNSDIPVAKEAVIPIPTSDGGVEHTAALFAPCGEWLKQAQSGEIILFPPQFFLMYLFAPYFQSSTSSPTDLQDQRRHALRFMDGDGGNGVKWADKAISPKTLFFRKSDGRSVLALHEPGLELRDSGRKGDDHWVVFVKFTKQGPRNLEVRLKEEVLEEERLAKEKL